MSILKKGFYASQFPTKKNYLTLSSDAPFSIKFNQKSWDGVLEYSPDTENWYEWDASEINSVNNKIYLRGLGNSVITGVNDAAYAMIITSPTNSDISCAGNIMTLLDHASPETAVMGGYCFFSLFRGTNLITAPELPATTLVTNCYRNMFAYCANLTVAPELPATTLANECYRNMFAYCTGIAISKTPTGIYQKPWRIPSVGTIASEPTNWSTNMLGNTSGTFTGNPSINTTYYQAD